MSHWAEIDEDGKVLRVIVGNNDDPNGDEGYSWIVENLGGQWVQTSYNSNFRKNFAGIDYTYDKDMDAFIAPKPYESWTLDQETAQWVAPSPYPEDEKFYVWDEEGQRWKSPSSDH